MAMETMIIKEVRNKISDIHDMSVDVWFQHGTLWADVFNPEVVDTIKETVEGFTGNKVTTSKLSATETEPWDQWAFDITMEKLCI
jgi:hypothetical protein